MRAISNERPRRSRLSLSIPTEWRQDWVSSVMCVSRSTAYDTIR